MNDSEPSLADSEPSLVQCDQLGPSRGVPPVTVGLILSSNSSAIVRPPMFYCRAAAPLAFFVPAFVILVRRLPALSTTSCGSSSCARRIRGAAVFPCPLPSEVFAAGASEARMGVSLSRICGKWLALRSESQVCVRWLCAPPRRGLSLHSSTASRASCRGLLDLTGLGCRGSGRASASYRRRRVGQAWPISTSGRM